MDVISPLLVQSSSHHRFPKLLQRQSTHGTYHDRADRTFTTRLGRSPKFPLSPHLRRSFLWVGGAVCVSTCLLWYYKNHLQLLHAATATEEASEVGIRGGGRLHPEELQPQLQKAKSKARELLQRVKDEHGCPGIVAAVSVNGEPIWSDAIGYADVENHLPMTTRHVLRIASISKVLTMTALAKLWEEGKVDIDRPLQEYVPTFPEKVWEKEKVTITTRHVLSHLSGIRHYGKSANDEKDSTVPSAGDTKASSDSKGKPADANSAGKKELNGLGDAKFPEMFSQTKYNDVTSALHQFKDDPLVHKPGSKFLYSSHAWTLVSAVIESAAKKPYLEVMRDTFNDLGLTNTVPDYHERIIAYRARTYQRNAKNRRLQNTPFVDLSNKWAGGGFLSTVGDLVKFGDAMLYSYQYSPRYLGQLPGYLKPETIQKLWVPIEEAAPKEDSEGRYGLGWCIIDKPQKYGQGSLSKHFILHTGGAVGASSVLLMEPWMGQGPTEHDASCRLPRGVSVAIIANIGGVGLSRTAQSIAGLFRDVK